MLLKRLTKSLQKSSEVVNISTATYMTSLQEKMNKPESRDKASIWLPKAQEAQQLSNTAYKFIQNVKDSLLRAADFNPKKMVIQHLKKIISIFQPGLWLKAVMVNNSTSNCQISERNC